MRVSAPPQETGPIDEATVETRYQKLEVERRLFGRAPKLRVGRYIVQSRLGWGGMGSVYAAHDPDLDRPVAIKVLRTRLRSSAQAASRLLREAQAMARLSHPHVVEVYEVGEYDGQVFIAMELLEGVPLSTWLQTRPHRDAICDTLAQAGQGLAAAHAAGVIHRDFKPDNVVIGRAGQVKVVDFGLASELASGSPSAPALSASDAPMGPSTPGSLTITGRTVGTPVYMSPEQFLGEAATHRSDQWSFCVVLFEALHGRRPHEGESFEALRNVVLHGEPRDALRGSSAPAFLRAIVARGLQRDPNDRFESMDHLLRVLAAGRRRRSSRWLGAGVALGMAATVGWLGRGGDDGEPRSCHAAADELAGSWDDARRGEVLASLSGSTMPTTAESAARVVATLDGYAERFAVLHAQACERHRSGEPAGDRHLDREMDCLHRRRVAFAAVVDVLAEGGAPAVQSALEASLTLPSLEVCSDPAAAAERAAVPDDPAVAAEVETLQEALARAEALRVAGEDPQALAITERLIARVQALGYPPLTAEASLVHGRVMPDPAEAEGHLETAYFVAGEIGDWDLATEAATSLVHAVGSGLRRHEDGLSWADHAEAALRRQGRTVDGALLAAKAGVQHEQGTLDSATATYQRALELSPASNPRMRLQRAAILAGMAQVEIDEAEHDAAMEHLALALTTIEAELGVGHPKTAAVIAGMGDALRAAGKPEAAVERHRRAVEVVVDALGAEHRQVASYRSNLAQSLMRAGEHAAALQEALAAREAVERNVGADHPDLANAYSLVGMVENQLGHYDEALRCFLRARTILEVALDPEHASVTDALERIAMAYFGLQQFDRALPVVLEIVQRQQRTFGAEHPVVGRAESNLGILYMNLDDDAAAVPHLERAVAIGERALEPDHPSNAIAHANLAEALTNLEDYAGAIEHFDRALTIQERALGQEHRDVAFTLKARSLVHSRLQQYEPARADAERSVAIYTRIDAPPAERGAAHLRLGEALWEMRGQRSLARAEVRRARAEYVQAGAASADRVAAVDAWLSAHRG